MKPYPKYKDSGVEWIGEVPEGWEKSKIKFCTEFINGYAFKSDDYVNNKGIPLIRIGDIKPEIDFNEAQKVPEEYAAIFKTFAVKKNDILVALTGATIGKSSVYKSTRPALLNQRVAILRPKGETHNNFLKFFINSDIFKKLIEYECVGGAQENIGKKEIGSCVLYLPKLLDQVQTSLFLDHKTAQIDDLISKKQKLIELLKEERVAIINQAVTKGLNPDAPMKDSGIKWLGDVPEHWEIKRLKFVSNFKSGNGITADLIKNDGEYAVYGGNGLRGYASSYTHEGAYVLIGRQGALCGNINYADGKFWASEHAVVATLVSDYNLFWFGELLRAMNLNQYSQSAAQPGLSVDHIKNFFIPIPSPNEQDVIAVYLDHKTTKIDQTISKIEKQIDLLQEYRTAIISNVVTGKIDVRDGGSNG